VSPVPLAAEPPVPLLEKEPLAPAFAITFSESAANVVSVLLIVML
jgi:hypothetical protein